MLIDRISAQVVGRVMVAIAVAGLVVALVGTVVAWQLVGQVGDTVEESLVITEESVMTIEDTIVVADQVVNDVGAALGALDAVLVQLRDVTSDVDAVLVQLARLPLAPSDDLETTLSAQLRQLSDDLDPVVTTLMRALIVLGGLVFAAGQLVPWWVGAGLLRSGPGGGDR